MKHLSFALLLGVLAGGALVPLQHPQAAPVATPVAKQAAVSHGSSDNFTDKELETGFISTVFSLEYRSWNWRAYKVKKFSGPVRIFIHTLSASDRSADVRAFVQQMNADIDGLTVSVTTSPAKANFDVYVVDRAQYDETVRDKIYHDPDANVPGSCLVRVEPGQSGIRKSTAVIVANDGEFLFRRCMIEELLQGLGPLNDDDRLVHSVFNDKSKLSEFTLYDRMLLNMLYDKRIKPGMRAKDARKLLPELIRDVRARVH